MGDAPLEKDIMADDSVEEIIAEEDTQGKVWNLLSPFYLSSLVIEFISHYGWFVLFGLIFLYVVWKKLLEPEWRKWRSTLDAQRESARYHKDPDLALKRMQGMEVARQRMQSAHNVAASKHLEKMKQIEEAKRFEKIEDWERHKKGLGYCNKTKVQEAESLLQTTSSKRTSQLRSNDYNPLMGSSGGAYRPSKKGRGGGCPSCQ